MLKGKKMFSKFKSDNIKFWLAQVGLSLIDILV